MTPNTMVVGRARHRWLDPDAADRVFGALTDGPRRDIVTRVLGGPSSVAALAERYAMSFAAVQRHVAVLEPAGPVTKELDRTSSGDADPGGTPAGDAHAGRGHVGAGHRGAAHVGAAHRGGAVRQATGGRASPGATAAV